MLQFQTVATPDGLLFRVFGQIEGSRHDITMYREAGMDEILVAGLYIDGVQYDLYGEKSYFLRPLMQISFQEPVDGEQDTDKEEQNTNRRRSVIQCSGDTRRPRKAVTVWTTSASSRCGRVPSV